MSAPAPAAAAAAAAAAASSVPADWRVAWSLFERWVQRVCLHPASSAAAAPLSVELKQRLPYLASLVGSANASDGAAAAPKSPAGARVDLLNAYEFVKLRSAVALSGSGCRTLSPAWLRAGADGLPTLWRDWCDRWGQQRLGAGVGPRFAAAMMLLEMQLTPELEPHKIVEVDAWRVECARACWPVLLREVNSITRAIRKHPDWADIERRVAAAHNPAPAPGATATPPIARAATVEAPRPPAPEAVAAPWTAAPQAFADAAVPAPGLSAASASPSPPRSTPSHLTVAKTIRAMDSATKLAPAVHAAASSVCAAAPAPVSNALRDVAHVVSNLFPPAGAILHCIAAIVSLAHKATANQNDCRSLGARVARLECALRVLFDHLALESASNPKQPRLREIGASLEHTAACFEAARAMMLKYSQKSSWLQFLQSSSIAAQFAQTDESLCRAILDLQFVLVTAQTDADRRTRSQVDSILQELSTYLPQLLHNQHGIRQSVDSVAEQMHAIIQSQDEIKTLMHMHISRQATNTAIERDADPSEASSAASALDASASSSPPAPSLPLPSSSRVPWIPFSQLVFAAPPRLLGEGRRARVWAGSWRGSSVAIKEIKRTDPGNGTQRHDDSEAALDAQLQAIITIRHDRIITCHGACRSADQSYLVFELMEGNSLSDRLHGLRPGSVAALDAAQKLRLLEQVLSGLSYLHAPTHTKPVLVHADLKPSNVLLDGCGNAKIAGLSTQRTMGAPLGSWPYRAPEQPHAEASPHTDMYAVGVLLWELWSGRRPWAGHSDASIAVDIDARPAQRSLPVPPPDCPHPMPEPLQVILRNLLGPPPRLAAIDVLQRIRDTMHTHTQEQRGKTNEQ